MALAKTAASAGYDDHLIGKINENEILEKKSALLCMMGRKGSNAFSAYPKRVIVPQQSRWRPIGSPVIYKSVCGLNIRDKGQAKTSSILIAQIAQSLHHIIDLAVKPRVSTCGKIASSRGVKSHSFLQSWKRPPLFCISCVAQILRGRAK